LATFTLEEKNREKRNQKEQLQRENWLQKAANNGTTEKHLYQREHEKHRLTELNDFFHKGMSTYRRRTLNYTTKSLQDEKYSQKTQELFDFFISDFEDRQVFYTYHSDVRKKNPDGYTSDDTKRVEARPNKRDCSHNYNIVSDLVSNRPKQPRHGSLYNDDSSVTGLSTN
jgi:hypothetical protein